MKLIFLNRYFHPDISATSQMLSSLAFHLAAAGSEVHVITSRQRYDDPAAQLPASEELRGVHVHRVRTSRFGRSTLPGRALDYASFYLLAMWKLAILAASGDIVIAKTDPPLISVPAAFVSRLRGARLVNWLQDVFPEVAERMGLRIARFGAIRAARAYSLRTAAKNVVLGERMRTYLETASGAMRMEVIHNWADGSAIVPIDRSANALRREWGLAGKFVVGYSGNMGRVHDFGSILEVATQLREHTNIVFLFVGGGHHLPRLQSEVESRGLGNVLFRPYQPQGKLAESLAVADLHLTSLAASMEGLIVPSKIYGILAAGRPTVHVGDPRGEVASILASAEAGFTVPPADARTLASRILELAADPRLVADLGRNARRAFDASYSETIAFGKWTSLLRDLGAAQPAGTVTEPRPARADRAS